MSPSAREVWYARRLGDTVSGLARLHLLRVGIKLGLFEALRDPVEPERLARDLALEPDLTAAWLRAAHAQGLVRRARPPARGYRASGFARWLLESPESASLLALIDQGVESYAPVFERLPELAKGAERPRFGGEAAARRAAAVSRLTESRALAALSRIPGARDARRVLDVGCGHGSYLAGLLVRYRDAHGLGIELEPEVAEEARRRLREADVTRRGEIRVGDFMTLELPRGSFDLILLNNNLYYFPPDRHPALFQRALGRLAPGGVLAIQVPIAERGAAARAIGATASITAFDLFLRAHSNLYGLPDVAPLRAALAREGFADTGDTSILPGARYIWGRCPAR